MHSLKILEMNWLISNKKHCAKGRQHILKMVENTSPKIFLEDIIFIYLSWWQMFCLHVLVSRAMIDSSPSILYIMQWKLWKVCHIYCGDHTMNISWLINTSSSSLDILSCYGEIRTCSCIFLSWFFISPASNDKAGRGESPTTASDSDKARIFSWMFSGYVLVAR